MAIELSTAGIKVGWALETITGAKPTTGYTRVRGVKNIPSFNQEPETLEVTDLNDLVWRRYIDGLKDVGGALAFTCNHTEEFMTDWDDIMDAYETGAATELQIWWHINIPGLTKGFFFRGNPSELGLGEAGVSAVLEIDAFVTPTFIHGWDTKVVVNEPT